MQLMIDIETLGKKPGCAVASIGAVQFDPRAGVLGKERLWTLNVQEQLDLGFTYEWDTLKWWLSQSDQARFSTFFSDAETKFRDAIFGLAFLINETRKMSVNEDIPTDFGIWANSPSFDLSILEHDYRVVQTDVPWTYKEPRDCRTAFAMTGFDYHSFTKSQPFVAHNALADARMQANGIIEAYKALR